MEDTFFPMKLLPIVDSFILFLFNPKKLIYFVNIIFLFVIY